MFGIVLENIMSTAGIEGVTDTVKHDAPSGQVFVGLSILETTTIAAIAFENAATGNAITGFAISARDFIPMRFTSITLTSGRVIAHRGV